MPNMLGFVDSNTYCSVRHFEDSPCSFAPATRLRKSVPLTSLCAQGSSPIRMISTIDPVKGASNSNLFCGQSAQVAAYTAPAKSGSNVTVQWSGAPGGGSNVSSPGYVLEIR